jgi:crooked neck
MSTGKAISDRYLGLDAEDEESPDEPVEKDEEAAEQARLEGIKLARQVLQRGYEDIRKRWKNEPEGPVRDNLKEQVCLTHDLESAASLSALLNIVCLHAVLLVMFVAFSQRSIILDHWKLLETEIGDEEALSRVEAMMPKPMRRWRKLDDTGDKEECKLSVDQGLYKATLVLIY